MIPVTSVPEHFKKVLTGVRNLYIGDQPSLAEECVCLTLEDGMEDLRYFGQRNSNARPMLVINIRSTKYLDAMDMAELLRDRLNNYHDDDIAGCYISGSPVYLGRNQQKLHEAMLSFLVSLR